MPKIPNSFDDYDDISLNPITGEGKVLSVEPSELDDEKIRKLLAEIDQIESSNSFSSNSLSNRSVSRSTSKLTSLTHRSIEKEAISAIENKSVPESPKEVVEESPKEEFKKTPPKPIKVYTTSADQSSNNSLLKVATISIATLILVVGAVVYSFWQPSSVTEENIIATPLPSEVQELFVDVSDEAANFVRKSNSKSSGTTIEQALAGYLNGSVGQDWQALGWKSSLEQEKQNTFSVAFVWKEGSDRKEAVWQLDLQAKKLTPINSIAEEVTPVVVPAPNNNANAQQQSQPIANKNIDNKENNQPTK
ncbi:MAG: hypothetical protein FD167_922 [bacterium]|nr:MAG: hypothetical protein FD167_922 [bacterium]